MKFTDEQLQSLGCKLYDSEQFTQSQLYINDYVLNCTCRICPEQYDILYNGLMVGYFRLRYGKFTLTFPDIEGQEVHRYYFEDNWQGEFDSDEDREEFLTRALEQLTLFISHKLAEKEYINNLYKT